LRTVIDDGVKEELIEESLRLYQNKEITLWKAAELAGISLSKMMSEANRRRIPHQYSVDDLLHDIDVLERME
jgi:predicted HTH domain antitoxin